MLPEKSGKVFISHATSDKALAESLADLLQAGIGLNHNQIFCTSLAGKGIPAGTDFKHHIQTELANSNVVLALLTPNFYASAFCLCELGGTWMLSKDFLPVMTSGFGDLKAVLKGVQALRIQEDTDLDEIRDRLSNLASPPTPTSTWSVKKAKFLSELSGILEKLPKPEMATMADLMKVSDERNGYREAAEKIELELKTLSRKYQDLAKTKDREEARKVDIRYSSEDAQFESLKKAVAKAIGALPQEVREALYYYHRGEDWFPQQNEDWGEIKECVERGFLSDADPGFSVSAKHPKIKPAIRALGHLAKFVEKASEDFYSNYEETYGDELSFKSRGFWDEHI
jgi:hypothetical protein